MMCVVGLPVVRYVYNLAQGKLQILWERPEVQVLTGCGKQGVEQRERHLRTSAIGAGALRIVIYQ